MGADRHLAHLPHPRAVGSGPLIGAGGSPSAVHNCSVEADRQYNDRVNRRCFAVRNYHAFAPFAHRSRVM